MIPQYEMQQPSVEYAFWLRIPVTNKNDTELKKSLSCLSKMGIQSVSMLALLYSYRFFSTFIGAYIFSAFSSCFDLKKSVFMSNEIPITFNTTISGESWQFLFLYLNLLCKI